VLKLFKKKEEALAYVQECNLPKRTWMYKLVFSSLRNVTPKAYR
jgi:hypothetical protein